MTSLVAADYAVAELSSVIYPFEAKSTENLCDFSFHHLCFFLEYLAKLVLIVAV